MIKKKTKTIIAVLAALGLCTAIGTRVMAADLVFPASQGDLAASVTFHNDGAGNLVVTLANTSTHDVLDPTAVLTAVFFTTAGTLTPVSAALDGSTVLFGPTGGGNVGGEWAYKSGLGISSAGYGLFGAANFNGANLQGPAAVDGLQYGITSPADNPATGNAAVTGGNALIKSSVVFTLSGYGGLNPQTDIGGITFQYGTALTDPHFPPHVVPEPTTFIAGALLLLPFGASAVRILRNKRTA